MQSTDLRPIDVTDRGVVGYEVWHPRRDDPSKQCACSVGTAEWGPDWKLWRIVKPFEAGLTLSPSVVCTTCGAHGFVRDGTFTY